MLRLRDIQEVAEIVANLPQAASGAGMVGTGSSLIDVSRVRDSYMDYSILE
jgi:flagellar hook-associated protein FlgK